jgi:hypothetical protein
MSYDDKTHTYSWNQPAPATRQPGVDLTRRITKAHFLRWGGIRGVSGWLRDERSLVLTPPRPLHLQSVRQHDPQECFGRVKSMGLYHSPHLLSHALWNGLYLMEYGAMRPFPVSANRPNAKIRGCLMSVADSQVHHRNSRFRPFFCKR